MNLQEKLDRLKKLQEGCKTCTAWVARYNPTGEPGKYVNLPQKDIEMQSIHFVCKHQDFLPIMYDGWPEGIKWAHRHVEELKRKHGL